VKFLNYLRERAVESSTWVGLTLLWTAAGITLHPELTSEIVAAGLAIAGFIKMWERDKKTF